MLDINKLDFEKSNGLIPAIIQNDKTMEVLMLGYMNKESLEKTLKEKKVCFYSRTREKLWLKGETSGNFLNLVSIAPDCDNDTLLIRVNPVGPTCHTGNISCFSDNYKNELGWFSKLEDIIEKRKTSSPETSYTAKLFQKGIQRISQKVGEEGVETALAAATDSDNFIDEASDLMFHLLVLLSAKNASLKDVAECLEKRNK